LVELGLELVLLLRRDFDVLLSFLSSEFVEVALRWSLLLPEEVESVGEVAPGVLGVLLPGVELLGLDEPGVLGVDPGVA
jgi:hypothetical protein